MVTHGEMIEKVSRTLAEPFTRRQLIEEIRKKYSKSRAINVESLGTDIAGCCVNLKSHQSLPDLPLILVNIGRGTYRRYDPSKDKHLNQYLRRNTKRSTQVNLYKASSQKPPNQASSKAIFYNYINAEQILRKKGLLDEVHQIITEIEKVDHRKIQSLFAQKGWNIEHNIHPQVRWAWDAYKEKVPVSIEFSLIDAVHRDLLRLLLWNHENKVEAVIYITSTFKEPKFKNVKRDLEIFRPIFDVPVLLIGLRA